MLQVGIEVKVDSSAGVGPRHGALSCCVRAEQGLAVVAAEQEAEPVQVLAQLADVVCSGPWLRPPGARPHLILDGSASVVSLTP